MNLEELADSLAERLKAVCEEVGTKAYKWSAGKAGLDSVPAAVVQIPAIKRTKVGQPENHLGELDVPMTFEVIFFFDASDVAYFMPGSISIVTGFIEAIDDDITLGGKAAEAKVVNSEPGNVEDSGSSRKLFAYTCTVEVLAFI